MHNALIYCLFLLLPLPALAQFVTISAPHTVQSGIPFSVEVTLTCPQPSELPPPFECNPGVPVSFRSSDSSATVPSGSFYLLPDQPMVLSSPFILRRVGAQSILAYPSQDFPALPTIGKVVVQVLSQVSPAPALSPLATLLLVICIFLAAAPNYSLKRTAANRRGVD